MSIKVFRRVEKKYLITKDEYLKILELSKDKLIKDVYYKSNICSIYFDTNNDDLINLSINKPIYKEKIRLRSYDVPTLDSYVFLELKRKYKGVVGKRRIKIKLRDFYNYYNKRILCDNSQIMKEIDYVFKRYDLVPKIFLANNRYSYKDIKNGTFRVTFDYNIRSRKNNLNLEYGDNGEILFDNNLFIMEVKILNSIPLWFSDILSKLKIYPISFSKYGTVYKKERMINNV